MPDEDKMYGGLVPPFFMGLVLATYPLGKGVGTTRWLLRRAGGICSSSVKRFRPDPTEGKLRF